MHPFFKRIHAMFNMFVSDMDGFVIYINTLFALYILSGPWYIITTTHFFNHTNCLLNKGTVIVPFITELCGTKFMDTPDSNWNSVYALSIFMFISFVILQMLHKYEKNKITKKIGLLLQFLILPIQCGILYLSVSVVTKPEHSNEKTIIAVLISGITLSFLRVSKLVYYFIKGDTMSDARDNSRPEENTNLLPPFRPGLRK